jgi:hypothetical protein
MLDYWMKYTNSVQIGQAILSGRKIAGKHPKSSQMGHARFRIFWIHAPKTE